MPPHRAILATFCINIVILLAVNCFHFHRRPLNSTNMASIHLILTHSLHQWLHTGRSTLALKVMSLHLFKLIISQEMLQRESTFKGFLRVIQKEPNGHERSVVHDAHWMALHVWHYSMQVLWSIDSSQDISLNKVNHSNICGPTHSWHQPRTGTRTFPGRLFWLLQGNSFQIPSVRCQTFGLGLAGLLRAAGSLH